MCRRGRLRNGLRKVTYVFQAPEEVGTCHCRQVERVFLARLEFEFTQS